MQLEYTIPVWELGQDDADLKALALLAGNLALRPTYLAHLLVDNGARVSLLLREGSRPSLEPGTRYYLPGRGLCALVRTEALPAGKDVHYVLRLEVEQADAPPGAPTAS